MKNKLVKEIIRLAAQGCHRTLRLNPTLRQDVIYSAQVRDGLLAFNPTASPVFLARSSCFSRSYT